MKSMPSPFGSVCALLAAVLLCCMSITPCSAAGKGLAGGACGTGKLLLFTKNPSSWRIIKGGASGKLIYREKNGTFTLTASGLLPRSSYALIRCADAPPHAEILVRGTSDQHGLLTSQGVWKNWTRKFWLVSGEDVSGNAGDKGSFRAWRPERYLFEEKQLGIACPCPETEAGK
jgi:hypothetical protein